MMTTKEKILWAAMELLLERDIQEIKTRDVATKAGVSVSQLHYHFNTKNELFKNAIINATGFYFRKWVEDNINLENPSLKDLETYFLYLLENPIKFPSVCRSKIYMVLQGVELSSMYAGVMDDLKRILTGLLPGISQERIIKKAHILNMVLTSLRVSTSHIEEELGLDYKKSSDREVYSNMILKELLPELYKEN